MIIQEHVPLGTKTTMKIGGSARYYAELATKIDVEEAQRFAQEHAIPMIVLGGGSNTVFADDEVQALVVRIVANALHIEGNTVTVEAGMILASLINECAAKGLDLSALAGIPGTMGGAIFGNAGQGPKGTWLDTYISSVTALVDGKWRTLTCEECMFRYRESVFKTMPTILIWKVTLALPSRSAEEIIKDIDDCVRKRFETQIQAKTAGSCFKGLSDGTPAWKLIEAAGMRGAKIGSITVSEKHANFLVNAGGGTFADLLGLVRKIKSAAPDLNGIEMRLYGENGKIVNL